MGKFHVKLKKQNKLGTGLVSEVSLRTGPFSTGPESGALCTENSYSPSAKITESAFLIQMRTVLWKCKGQEYLHSPDARAGIRGGCFLCLVSQEIRSGRQATL